MERTYNLREVSQILGITVRTARYWISCGRLNAIKLADSNRWMVRESEIKRLRGE